MSDNMLGGSALDDVAGPLQDFAKKLGGEEGLEWLEAFKRFLRKKDPWKKFLILRAIKLGTGLKTAGDFSRALQDGGCSISHWANNILGNPAFIVKAQETKVNLVVVSVADLGFKKGARCSDIYKKAQELGFERCPAEVGPQLRLQYRAQPMGELFRIEMDPIANSDGALHVFFVGCNDRGLLLSSNYGYPDDFDGADSEWVFVLPHASELLNRESFGSLKLDP